MTTELTPRITTWGATGVAGSMNCGSSAMKKTSAFGFAPWTTKPRADEVGENEVIDHVWDGDLQERNSPLPRWWLWLFYITIVFGVGYMIYYPGLGKFQGMAGWSSAGFGSLS